MTTLESLREAGARALAAHARRLGERLDVLGGRLADEAAHAVAEAVAGAVHAAVHALFGEPAPAAGRDDPWEMPDAGAGPGYWGDGGGWGDDPYARLATPAAGGGGPGDDPDRRWVHAAVLAAQVLAAWLDRWERRARWLAAAAAGAVATLASLAGRPGGVLAGGAAHLAVLAGLLRSAAELLPHRA